MNSSLFSMAPDRAPPRQSNLKSLLNQDKTLNRQQQQEVDYDEEENNKLTEELNNIKIPDDEGLPKTGEDTDTFSEEEVKKYIEDKDITSADFLKKFPEFKSTSKFGWRTFYGNPLKGVGCFNKVNTNKLLRGITKILNKSEQDPDYQKLMILRGKLQAWNRGCSGIVDTTKGGKRKTKKRRTNKKTKKHNSNKKRRKTRRYTKN